MAALLAGGLSFLANSAVELQTSQKLRQIEEVVITFVLVMVLALVLYFWWQLSRSLRRIRKQLGQFEADRRIGLIMIDENDGLAKLVASINSHLTRVNTQLEDKRIQKRELKLQARVAETERQQIEAIIYSLSEAVLVTDSYDDLQMANRAAEKLFQFRFNPLRRLPIGKNVGDDELAALIRQTRESKSRRETKVLQREDPKQGVNLSLKVLLSCIFGPDQEVLGVVVVIHDVTADQEVARLKDEFFNDVSHELKTPLASICAYAEMLTEPNSTNQSDYQGFGKIIKEQGKRLSHLVDDILDVSRIESGALEPNRQRTNLAETIEEVIATLLPQAQEKQITLHCDLPKEGLVVDADRKMIYHAILNLMENALKYSPQNRQIKLIGRLDCDSQTVTIDVLDQGIGIPEKCCERIFDKFYRVEKNKHFAEGSGLGLNLVKRIVEEFHDGTITVQSRVGQGSRFRMTIPIYETSQLSY